MASPQCEDGYTRIANELLEALLRAGLAGREWAVVMAVIRLTYGYGRKTNKITLSTLSKMTGYSKENVCRTIKQLRQKGLLIVSKEKGRLVLGIQKDHERWELSKSSIVKVVNCQSRQQEVVKVVNRELSKSSIAPSSFLRDIGQNERAKENIYKENSLKKTHTNKVCALIEEFCQRFNLEPDTIEPLSKHPNFAKTVDIILYLEERGKGIRNPVALLNFGLRGRGLIPPEGFKPFEERERERKEAYERRKQLEERQRQEEEKARERLQKAQRLLAQMGEAEKEKLFQEAKRHPLAGFLGVEKVAVNLLALRQNL